MLYGKVDQSFYTRQIAREVDASVGAVQRELENLSSVGLIIRSSVGSQVSYQANRHATIAFKGRSCFDRCYFSPQIANLPIFDYHRL